MFGHPPSPEKVCILILNTRNSCSEMLSNLLKIIQLAYQLGQARLCCDNKQSLYLSDLKHKGLFFACLMFILSRLEGPTCRPQGSRPQNSNHHKYCCARGKDISRECHTSNKSWPVSDIQPFFSKCIGQDQSHDSTQIQAYQENGALSCAGRQSETF